MVDLCPLLEEQPVAGAAQDCCPFDSSQASDCLKTLAEVPTNPTLGHPPQLYGPQRRSGGIVSVGPQALTAHCSAPEALPSFLNAFSQLYKSLHVCPLLEYPRQYCSLDIQPWKRALDFPSEQHCTSDEGSKSLQSPEVSKYVKEVILRHFCHDFAQRSLKTKGWLVCQNRWNSSFGEWKHSPG